MKHKKKPIVIEAEQYTEYGKLVKGMCNSQSCFTGGNNKPHVHTIHANQIVLLEVGDFVIPEPDGEHYYPCKPDIFAATYEAVEDSCHGETRATPNRLGDILEAGSSFLGNRTFWLVEKISAAGMVTLRELKWCDISEPGCVQKTERVLRRKIQKHGIWISDRSRLSKSEDVRLSPPPAAPSILDHPATTSSPGPSCNSA